MDGSEQKEEQSFGHMPAQGPLFRVLSVFIPGFVSHHDTYFSLRHKRLFVTIVSPLLLQQSIIGLNGGGLQQDIKKIK